MQDMESGAGSKQCKSSVRVCMQGLELNNIWFIQIPYTESISERHAYGAVWCSTYQARGGWGWGWFSPSSSLGTVRDQMMAAVGERPILRLQSVQNDCGQEYLTFESLHGMNLDVKEVFQDLQSALKGILSMILAYCKAIPQINQEHSSQKYDEAQELVYQLFSHM
jgi:hypothetical protein